MSDAPAYTTNDGNCLPSHHDDTRGRGAFQPLSYEENNYDACHEENGYDSNEEEEEEEDMAFSLNELMYSAHSFHVISFPVSITMILAALAVTFVNTPQTIQQGEAIMSQAYHVWSVDAENDSTSKQLFLDFANGLVIVTVIGTMTFGIVLLYKYRCMKFLIGYMMFSSMTLLGVLGGELFNIAIEKYRIPIDWFSFVVSVFNFAVVGVTAIFYAKGIPTYITQGYLICSSVIISWQLSHFDTISTWTLLIMLGLYDLCAVLTPCGPLRFLVNLMSDDDAPEMPGLLYEAEIPEGLKRPVMSGRGTGEESNNNDEDEDDNGSTTPPSSMTADRYEQPSSAAPPSSSEQQDNTTGEYSASSGDVEMSSTMINGEKSHTTEQDSNSTMEPLTITRERSDVSDTSERSAAPKTAMIPFAIAKLYKLALTSPPFQPGKKKSGRRKRSVQSDTISTSPLLKSDSAEKDEGSISPTASEDGITNEPYVIPDGEYTPKQKNTIVDAILPKNGAKIVKQPRRHLQADKNDRWGVIGANGVLKRVLFVEKSNGKVYEEMDDDDDDEYEGRFSNTIKLGLGDFIFYSVLVAKSAQYSFPCFISSFLVILAGLGGTLVLLAVYKHALPALPISIFLAVGFYVLVRFMAEPWIHAVMSSPFYV